MTNLFLPIRRTIAAASVLLLLSGCKSYQFGSPSLYRPDVQTVHVDMFFNDTYRKFLGERLTESVVKEIELNTPMRIVDRAYAQSIVSGRLVRERKRVLSETINDDPRNLSVDYWIEVTWSDRNGNSLMPIRRLRIDRGIDFVPEGGQSLTTAEQELINRLGRQIVQQMEMPW